MGTVFHVPEGDPAYGRRAFRNVRNLLDDEHIEADLVVICNSDGIEHLLTDAPTAATVSDLIAEDVTVSCCSNSLGTSDYGKGQLLDGVTIVPTAMGALTHRQKQGFAYIRP